MAYNTGNPIGSTDPRDLYDNAQNLDVAMNADQDDWTDRLGIKRATFRSAERAADYAVNVEIPAIVDNVDAQAQQYFERAEQSREAEFNASQQDKEQRFQDSQQDKEQRFNLFLANSGYQFMGEYGLGVELTEYNQVLRDGSGNMWRVSAATSLPYTTTGAGLPEGGAFVPVGDNDLRSDLINEPVNEKGALLVRGAVIYADDINGLRALPTSAVVAGQTALISSTNRAGEFIWMPGDRSGDVASDPESGIWVAPDDDSSGVSGAWMRQYSMWQGIRPEWFGAHADGVTDDTDGIRAAVACIGAIGAGVLLFGPRKYISKKIVLTSNTDVRGAGMHATEVTLADNSHVGINNYQNNLFQVGDFENEPDVEHENVSINDIILNGNSANNEGFGGAALFHAYRTGGISITNVRFVDSHNRGIDVYNMGYVHSPQTSLRINNVYIEGAHGEACYIRHASRSIHVNEMIIDDCAKTIGPAQIDRTSGVSASLIIDHSEGNYSNIKVRNCHGHGVWVRNVTGINITNITSTGNAGHGMLLDRFVSSSGASWIVHGNGQAEAGRYSDIFFAFVDEGYGRTKDLTVSGVSLGNGRVYFNENENKPTRTRYAIEFDDPEEDAIYENVTLLGVAYANNEYYDLGPSNQWGNMRLPRNRDTIHIGDKSRDEIIKARRHPIQRWGFSDHVYQRWSQSAGLERIERTNAITLTRGSVGTAIGPASRLSYAINEPRFEYDRVARRVFAGLLQEKKSTNLINESAAPSTAQSISVDAVEYTLSFEGPLAASITLSGAHSAVLNGKGPNSTASYTFTPNSGTLTVEFSGDVLNAQLEKGGAATSRIVTTTSARQRSFDYSEATVGDGFNKFDGALLIDFTLHEINTNRGILDIENGFRIQTSTVGPGGLSYVLARNSYGSLFSTAVMFGINTRTRIAVSWRRDSSGNSLLTLAINGRLYLKDEPIASGAVATEPGDRVGIFNRLDATDGESGWVHDLRFYSYSPTHSELATLSRID